MGAGCSNPNSAKVQDSIKAVQDLQTLNKEAQSHLKLIQAGNTQVLIDEDRLKLMGKVAFVEEEVDDKDEQSIQFMRTKHNELWLAVEINDTQKAQDYLQQYLDQQGLELRQQELYDCTGNSIIHKAASLGHAEVLMLLLERTGAKPDLLNGQLATPLHVVCKNNRLDAAKFLIGCGVDANCQDEHGQTPLLICCIHGHFELAKLLIDASSSGHLPEPLEVDSKDHRGLSPLNCAAIKGDLELVIMLVSNGGANVEGPSPKGCTPLLYAARGGYAEVTRFLLKKGASAMRQDNAGGTVLHHAIEKGHSDVLQVLIEHGVDVHAAIEIPDNGGRTPIFEAVDNPQSLHLLRLLTKSRKEGGFEAKVNIFNYSGQTPLFSAVREGNLDVVKVLVEECGAKVDLNQGELFKEDQDEMEDNYDSLQERFFIEAYKNCMTPLHLAVVMGYDEIALYLIEKGANPNLQTRNKGYICLHLAVLANKPEMIIELLTKTQANPYLPDFAGRTLQDMVEIFIPTYIDHFQMLLRNLKELKLKGIEEAEREESEEEESLAGLAKRSENPVVVTYYYNPDDERSISGIGNAGQEAIKKLYDERGEERGEQQKESKDQNGEDRKQAMSDFLNMTEDEMQTEDEKVIDGVIEEVFGRKVALGLISVDWKHKECALRLVTKQVTGWLEKEGNEDSVSMNEKVKAATCAVGLTCKEKVIKAFQLSLQLLSLLTTSQRVEKTGLIDTVKNQIVDKNIVLKLLQKSEEGNTRITNKIHECLLDLSFNPQIGESLTSSFVLQRINSHIRAILLKSHIQGIKLNSESRQIDSQEPVSQPDRQSTEASLGSNKGLLAQLALLYKLVNSFGIASRTRGALSVKNILKAVIPSIPHPNQDVRNAALKILLDVQRLSGCVNEEELSEVPEKCLPPLIEKIKAVKVEKNLQDTASRALQEKSVIRDIEAIKEEEGDETDAAECPETIKAIRNDSTLERWQEVKQIVEESANSKEWQEQEQALKVLEKILEMGEVKKGTKMNKKELFQEQFLQNCVNLLKNCLESMVMAVYLRSVQVSSLFLDKTMSQDVVYDSLQSLLTPVILRTTDTNSRIRKKSVELVNQVWDYKESDLIHDKLQFSKLRDESLSNSQKTDPTCQIIASILSDPQLGEKAVIGRLGLLVKRAQIIEGNKDLLNKPLQLVLGKNYEQIVEFACQWISHKNTKVRENAQRLLVEICRINCMDPRGSAFKQRIVNFILGLRSSQRDPLVAKINQICLRVIVQNTSPGRAQDLQPFIKLDDLDLGLPGKRAVSMDVAKQRLRSGVRRSQVRDSDQMLPQIGSQSRQTEGVSRMQPTLVLPHSEPLTEEQLKEYQSLIDLLGVGIVTCLVSKNWATRHASLQKVEEQLLNLDPNRRDPMSAEINRQNLPVEINFKSFLEFISESLKDPVLKNYILLLEVFQQALPIFFRHLQGNVIKQEMSGIIREIVKKTGDLKQKVRESSINFCLYLSHQSPVGPEFMFKEVGSELERVQREQTSQKKDSSVASSFANSHLISACLSLLSQYQTQRKILSVKNQDYEVQLVQVMDLVNFAIRHSNPQVRKEGERLFTTLYCEFAGRLEPMLVDSKAQQVVRMVTAAKQELMQQDQTGKKTGNENDLTKQTMVSIQNEQADERNKQLLSQQLADNVIFQDSLRKTLGGCEEHLQALKQANPQKRKKAIIEIKKVVSLKVQSQMTSQQARELFESLTLLMRQLLRDDNPENYIEALNLIKFITGSLAGLLTNLDLHLMMGSFIGVIVQNTAQKDNMRIQVQSDKVIVYFAKHQNIGPYIVGKEIISNIDKINRLIQTALPEKRFEVFEDKKPVLIRFYGLLQLLLQQFAIVLCYQADFYLKVIENLADTINSCSSKQTGQEIEDVAVKAVCISIVNNLYAIDYKLLDATVTKLDNLNRKQPLRKAIIEFETQRKQGKGYIDVGNQDSMRGPASRELVTPNKMRESQVSFGLTSYKGSLFSQGSSAQRGQSPQEFGSSQFGGFNKDPTLDYSFGDRPKRMASLNNRKQQISDSSYVPTNPVQTQSSWSRPKQALPPIEGNEPNLNKTGVLISKLPPISGKEGNYRFEVGRMNESTNTIPNKLRPTGQAGFSSKVKDEKQEGPFYEPGSGNRVGQRRSLGKLVNSDISSLGRIGGMDKANSTGLGGFSQVSWPQSIHTNQTSLANESVRGSQSTTSGLEPSVKNSSSVKPPLYVPSQRQPSEGRQLQQTNEYKSRTGFTSLSKPGEGRKSDQKTPFEVEGKGIGAQSGNPVFGKDEVRRFK